MWAKNLIRKIRYGGIYKIVDEQTIKINSLTELSKNLYNVIFEQRHGKLKNQSVYHGPMQELKDCRVIKSSEPDKKLAKEMIEVAEFNGFNGATYYWYFAKEARLIYELIDYEPPKEEGETYIPKTKRGKATAVKAVKPKGT